MQLTGVKPKKDVVRLDWGIKSTAEVESSMIMRYMLLLLAWMENYISTWAMRERL
jgi:hypothetical protein